MERREFLKIAFGFAAAAGAVTVTAATAQAAPLLPQSGMPPDGTAKPGEAAAQDENGKAEPAVATQDDLDSIGPEQVQWRRRRYWRRPYWRRPYWRRRYWRRRYWRPRPRYWYRRRRWRRRPIYL